MPTKRSVMKPHPNPLLRLAASAALLVPWLFASSTLAAPSEPAEPVVPSGEPTDPAAAAGPDDDDEPLITAIDLGFLLGLAVRLDDPAAFEADSRVGLRLGFGADVFFSEVVSVGLHVEHVDLGRESSGIGSTGMVRVDRDLNNLWLGLRAYPFASESIGAFVNLGAAAVWQSVAAAGVGWSAGQPDRGQTFRCEGADSISVALRAGMGVDFEVTEGLQLISAAAFDSYRLSDELLDGCAPGAGNASVLTAELALAYRFAPEW